MAKSWQRRHYHPAWQHWLFRYGVLNRTPIWTGYDHPYCGSCSEARGAAFTLIRSYGKIEHRSVPKQIEYWSQIGKIAAENPDLPYSVIRDILIADQEEPVGEYQFG